MIKSILLFLLSLASLCNCIDCPEKELCWTVETKLLPKKVSLRNLIEKIDQADQPEGYCSSPNPTFPLNNRKICPGGVDRDIGWKFSFNFKDSQAGQIYFQLGVNFGHAYKVLIDDVLTQSSAENYYWDQDWNDKQGVIRINQPYEPGKHKITIYGSGCCDGMMDLIYKLGSAGPAPFKSYNCPKGQICKDVSTVYYNKKISKILCDPEQFAENLKTSIETSIQPSRYCSATNVQYPLTHKSICPNASPVNIAWKYRFHFDAQDKGILLLRLKVNYEYGLALFVNGKFKKAVQREYHWKSQFNTDIVDLQIGYYEGEQDIVIYAEGGYGDQLQNIQFQNTVEEDGAAIERLLKYDQRQYQPCVEINAKPISFTDLYNHLFRIDTIDYIQIFMNRKERKEEQFKQFCDVSLPDFPFHNEQLCDGRRIYKIFDLKFTFHFKEAGTLNFDFGAVFEIGAIVFVDNELLKVYDNPLYWKGLWNETESIINVSFEYEPGTYVIQIQGGSDNEDHLMDFRSTSTPIGQDDEETPQSLEKCVWDSYDASKSCLLSVYEEEFFEYES